MPKISGMSNKRVLVIGGTNLDICGSPVSDFRLHDSNIGSVSSSAGGVGRNIAHNLRLLGVNVSIITAFGNDVFSPILKDNLTSLGIDISMSVESSFYPSSVYLYVQDRSGDMHVAINDMEIVSCITPEHIEKYIDRFDRFSAIVIDTNLSQETLCYIADHSAVPVYADAVSAAKAIKLNGLLNKLTCLKLNRMEAEILTGESDPSAAAKSLFFSGLKHPFVSCGKAGIITFDGANLISVPARIVPCINSTGAGDAATAAIIYSGIHGFSPRKTAVLAEAAGALTVNCNENVNPDISDILNEF